MALKNVKKEIKEKEDFKQIAETAFSKSNGESQKLTQDLNSSLPEKDYKPTVEIININTAQKQDLIQLPNVGVVTAERIMRYREDFGSFKSADDLLKVKGIGPKTLEKIFSISENSVFYEYFISNYIYENPSIFKSKGISLNKANLLRWTLDYPEDYVFLKKIFGDLYLDNKIFHMDDVLSFLKEHTEISKINSMYDNEFSHLKYQREMSKKK